MKYLYISWDVNPSISPLRQLPIKYILKVIFTPTCWIRGTDDTYNKIWTERLFNLVRDASSIEQGRYSDGWVSTFNIVIDNTYAVWVANHPYASFSPHNESLDIDTLVLPKRWVVLYLADVLYTKWGLVCGDHGVTTAIVDGRATGATGL